MGSREFAAQTFRWLNQVNWDHKLLLPVDVKVAVQLACHFNEEEDGRAWPSGKYIGDKIGVSERTVLRSVRRLHEHGHLRVDWGVPGRRHSNNYWMVEKTGTTMPVSSDVKPASVTKKTGIRGKKTGIAVPENHRRTTEGNHTRAEAPKNGGKGSTRPGGIGVAKAFDPEDMDRFWSVYPKQADRLATEKAFRKALELATAQEIIEGAARYARDPVRIARGERYTKHPANWLRGGGWGNPGAGITIDEHGNHIVTAPPPDDIDAMVNGILATGFTINRKD